MVTTKGALCGAFFFEGGHLLVSLIPAFLSCGPPPVTIYIPACCMVW